MPNQPDYDYLLKLDSWSKKDAALIISGFNPDNYRSVRFSRNDVPDELQEAHKLYRIFRSINFIKKYGAYEIHPAYFITECHKKSIPLPKPLQHVVNQLIENYWRLNNCTYGK